MKSLIAAAFLAFSALPTLACTCLQGEQSAALPPPDVIVDATVKLITRDSGGKPENRIILDVHRAFVGALIGRAMLRTANNPAACGVSFRTGQRLRIAMMRSGASYVTSSCLMQRALKPPQQQQPAQVRQPQPVAQPQTVVVPQTPATTPVPNAQPQTGTQPQQRAKPQPL